MRSLHWTVALTLLAVIAGAASQSCDDVDTQVCQGFASKTNVCSDLCLSKLCPRTCNNCPLNCYHCDGLSSPDLCNITQICPDRNYNCIVAESVRPDFSISYRQGCASSDVCDQLFGIVSGFLIGKRFSHNGDCCYDDLCNNRLIRDGSVNNVHQESTPVIPMSPNPTIASVCDDVDQFSCQRLVTIRKDMCTDDCILKACQRTCGKCARCYSCAYVRSPEYCSSIAKCEPGEKCYAFGTLNFSGEKGYRLGCLPENVCKQYDIDRVFGKRGNPKKMIVTGNHKAECTKGFHLVNGKCLATSQMKLSYPQAKRTSQHIFLTMEGYCCNEDLCNHSPLVHTTTTTTTTTTKAPTTTTTTDKPTTLAHDGCSYISGHHCPVGFDLVNWKCVAISSRPLTDLEAKNYCHQRCARPMDNLSDQDISHLRSYINFKLFNTNVQVVRIGAHADHKGRFHWDSTNLEIHGVPHSVHNDCLALLTAEPHHHHDQQISQYVEDPCHTRRYSICQATKH